MMLGIVSDMGTANVTLWSNLNIGYDKQCFFPHPTNNNLNVYVFVDAPHLLKLLDNGFHISKLTNANKCFLP